ncbi:hypothetical protein QTJ16_001827 [Diplocarpon rosae]|uniref:U4/U6.U5 small nuclear ribonucleoprotein 27kDa protein domain-containing protein n=1 Tax=Diplocarpon rosae TaxID=946125 RepID=A0AAD9T4R1_9HELO|nr:hypothetical protein QTJ16_001827 [Diplocarpon rosae]
MAEPPHKRARRPDSAQMWEESERRASPRGPRGGERQHGGDRRGERNRDGRYRSRSPRGRDGYERGGRRDYRDRDRERDRGMYPIEAAALASRCRPNMNSQDGGRDGRERGGDRGGDREREHRSKGTCAEDILLCFRHRPDGASQDGGRETRERLRERSRDRDRARDHERRDAKSRSPRPEREWGKKDIEVDKEPMHEHHDEKLLRNTRIETLPVATQIAAAASDHDHERMHIDTEAHPAKKGKKGKKAAKSIEDEDDLVIEDDGMAAMQAMMGFGGFGTTHQQKVAGNDIYAVRKEKKTEYRQYMNRVGGFNRPLSPSRD